MYFNYGDHTMDMMALVSITRRLFSCRAALYSYFSLDMLIAMVASSTLDYLPPAQIGYMGIAAVVVSAAVFKSNYLLTRVSPILAGLCIRLALIRIGRG